MKNDDYEKEDDLEKAYKTQASTLRDFAGFRSSKREETATDPDDHDLVHYGQESESRKASIPTKDYNYASGETTKFGKTDSENLKNEADDIDNEVKKRLRLKYLNKLKLSK